MVVTTPIIIVNVLKTSTMSLTAELGGSTRQHKDTTTPMTINSQNLHVSSVVHIAILPEKKTQTRRKYC